MSEKPRTDPLVLIRTPRQKCNDLLNLTFNGVRVVIIGEPKQGMNYARLVRIKVNGYAGQISPALLLTNPTIPYSKRDPLIISYKDLGNLEATLQIIGYKIEDMPMVFP